MGGEQVKGIHTHKGWGIWRRVPISLSIALVLLSPCVLYAAQVFDQESPEATTLLGSDLEIEWNLFSLEDEIRLGREAGTALALEIEPAANRDLDAYLSGIRDRLQNHENFE